MVEDIVRELSSHPDVVRVMVSDREGLLIEAQMGQAAAGSPKDAESGDDLWNAYMAQFAANITAHLKSMTLSRPMEMILHGTNDDLLIVWLGIGWLIARTKASADWPALLALVVNIRREFETLAGEPTYTASGP